MLPEDALEYELAVTFGGTMVMMILQVITGPIFTWLVWALAVAVVTLSYVDHCCVGWTRLHPSTQVRRAIWNTLLFLGAGTGLYWTIVLLSPDVDIRNLASILDAVQYAIRMHRGWGPVIYFGIYSQFYLCTLSFFRCLINTVLIIWSIIHTTEWGGPSNANTGDRRRPPPAPPSHAAAPTPAPTPHPTPAPGEEGRHESAAAAKPHVD